MEGNFKYNDIIMNIEQTILIGSQLVLGAAAVFLAIMIWSKTKDIAWIFLFISIIVAYIEIVFFILRKMQIISGEFTELLLPSLRMAFIIAAFSVIIIRRKSER